MPPPAIFAITAVSVSDLDRATRFYCDALGYRQLNTTYPGGEAGISARFLDLDGRTLELVAFEKAPPREENDQPLSRVGLLSHLAFNVADLPATEAAVIAAGGTIIEATRMSMDLAGVGPATIVYARDPDGIWIELLSIDEAARRKYVGLDG